MSAEAKSLPTPRVSVIMPVYNMAGSLPDAIRSVREQTLRDIEIILVNDGSTDDSPVICAKAAAEDPRVKVISGPNEGLSAALNKGLDAARGEWIGFCDADDRAHPELCQTLLDLAVRECADLPSVALRMVSPDGETPGVTDFPIAGDAETIRGRENVLLRAFYPLLHKTGAVKGYRVICLFRRDLIEARHIRFCSCMCEDETFMLGYLLSVETIAVVRRDLYDYIRTRPSACLNFFHGLDDFQREKSWCRQAHERERIFIESDLAAGSPRTIHRLHLHTCYHEAQVVCCDPSLTRRERSARLRDVRASLSWGPRGPRGLAVGVFSACLQWTPSLLALLLWAKRCKDKLERRFGRAAR
jgi:glycosyltransferase involved in cell wall biosynthesis